MKQTMNAFLTAFATETGLADSDADEQWAAFTRQLSDRERTDIEKGGRRSGERMGRQFLKAFPDTE